MCLVVVTFSLSNNKANICYNISMLNNQQQLNRARHSTYILFMMFGVLYTTLLSRLVKLRELLGNIDPGQTSLMLICLAIGNVSTAPIWGTIIERSSLRKVTRIGATCMATALVVVGTAAYFQLFLVVLVGCVMLGASAGCFNVSNNMSGIAVEIRAQRTLMPKFHAFYGVGVVIATAFSLLISTYDLPLLAQFIIVAIFAISVTMWRTQFLYAKYRAETQEPITSTSTPTTSKRSEITGRLLMIGGIVAGCSLAEGSGHDWITSGIVQGLETPESTAIAGFWGFAISLMAMRFAGSRLVDKFGRVAVLRVCFTAGVLGFALYIFSPSLPLVVVGCICWGFGVSMGYPLGISAASDGPGNSAFRASVLGALGTSMNIACPPIVGALANMSSIRLSLLIPMCGLGIALLCSKQAREQNDAKFNSVS
jgi:fucose permease